MESPGSVADAGLVAPEAVDAASGADEGLPETGPIVLDVPPKPAVSVSEARISPWPHALTTSTAPKPHPHRMVQDTRRTAPEDSAPGTYSPARNPRMSSVTDLLDVNNREPCEPPSYCRSTQVAPPTPRTDSGQRRSESG